MRLRQEERCADAARGPQFVFLSSDASLQGGTDFQMTLEDAIPRGRAHLVPFLISTAALMFRFHFDV